MTYPFEDLCREIQQAALARGVTVATAESCTGGRVAGALVSVDGASQYVYGGVVAYNDNIKHAVLGVSNETLAQHTAVSAEVCREMCLGVQRVMGVTCSVATTGYASCVGLPPELAGLVYVGVCCDGDVRVESMRVCGERNANINEIIEKVLTLLKTRLNSS